MLAFCVLASSPKCYAQAKPSHHSEYYPLEELQGFSQVYYYSPGHLQRAKSIA